MNSDPSTSEELKNKTFSQQKFYFNPDTANYPAYTLPHQPKNHTNLHSQKPLRSHSTKIKKLPESFSIQDSLNETSFNSMSPKTRQEWSQINKFFGPKDTTKESQICNVPTSHSVLLTQPSNFAGAPQNFQNSQNSKISRNLYPNPSSSYSVMPGFLPMARPISSSVPNQYPNNVANFQGTLPPNLTFKNNFDSPYNPDKTFNLPDKNVPNQDYVEATLF